MKTSRLYTYALVVLLSFAACKNTGTTDSKKVVVQTPLEEFNQNLRSIAPSTKSGADVAIFFELSGANFSSGLLADPLAWESYKVSALQAAAVMGIYTTDAIYQYAYDESEGAYLSWMAAKSLAQEIDIGEVFDGIIIKRVEEGLTQDDSLVFKFEEAMILAESTLSDTERLRVYTALVAGSYIEKLHLLMGVIWDGYDDFQEDTRLLLFREMLVFLFDQLAVLNELIALIEEYETIDDPGFLAYELKKMRDVYSGLDLSFENVSGLSAQQVFSNPKAVELRASVNKIRNHILAND